jgi:hypothetical protein
VTHTPGPWLMQLSNSGARIVRENRPNNQAPLKYDVICSGLGGNRDNARLIAAAPDMLRMLRLIAALDVIESEKTRGDLLDVIAKAEAVS